MTLTYVITDTHYYYKTVELQVAYGSKTLTDGAPADSVLTELGREGWKVKFVMDKYKSPEGTWAIFLLEKVVHESQNAVDP